MKNPPHPGRMVREECLEPLGLSVTEPRASWKSAGKPLTTWSSEKAGISAEMAVRLIKAFGSTPDTWLRILVAYDLAQVAESRIHVKPYRKAS